MDKTLAEKLLEQGIRLNGYAFGHHAITCPKCSHGRVKKTARCLSVKLDGTGATWMCHHCGWVGGLSDKPMEVSQRRSEPRRPPVRPKQVPDDPAPIVGWFAARGISEAVVRRNGIGFSRVWMPDMQAEVDAIAFPYRRNGETVNIKFRARAEKTFTQVKDAEKILYGLDDIGDSKEVIVVEGECDKLACEEAGLIAVLSVPDGAPVKLGAEDPEAYSAKFEYLANCAAYLEPLEKIIIAVDCDEKGGYLAEELARRFGKERCWRVQWSNGNDAPYKDANEVLIHHGAAVLRECITEAKPYPIGGLHEIGEFAAEVIQLYRDGRKRGRSTGWVKLDQFMTIRPGELSVVTGIPNHGKSEFLDAMAVNMATNDDDWRFAICSFENPPEEHISKLAEKYLKLPFWDGLQMRMTEDELRDAMAWASARFFLIRADDDAPTIDWILRAAKGAVLRYGIRGFILDPYNEIDHRRPPGQSETEYISQLLGKLKRFAQCHAVHVWIVAHPRIMHREDGIYPVPTPYDISGSANWANKADIAVVVHRPSADSTQTDIWVRKVRFKSVGRIGMMSLRYDLATGCYSELETAAPRRDIDD
jgi:twinkle protein